MMIQKRLVYLINAPICSPRLLLIGFILTVFLGCGSPAPSADVPADEPGTPVTLTTVSQGALSESVELNATSSVQLKTSIKANATGYLQLVNTQLGKYVSKGQEIFTIKTKEAESLGNTINILDSTFRFSGVVHIRSSGNGFVTMLNYRDGDYVQDGEQLATISDNSSLVFLMDLPYELKGYLNGNRKVMLELPDGTKLNGAITSSLPTVDLVSQTQSVVIRVNNSLQIPEGLIAKVRLLKNRRANATTLPRAAILANETQDRFWIMKLADSVTAVKIPIKKGLENDSSVEILAPAFLPSDKILLTGNYGLADTAKVAVKY